MEGSFYILPDLKQLLPVREVLVQQVETTPDKGITKETKADTRGHHFHEHCGCGQQPNSDCWNENADQLDSRRLLRKRWSR